MGARGIDVQHSRGRRGPDHHDACRVVAAAMHVAAAASPLDLASIRVNTIAVTGATYDIDGGQQFVA